jgi:hypothetical protein
MNASHSEDREKNSSVPGEAVAGNSVARALIAPPLEWSYIGLDLRAPRGFITNLSDKYE